MFEMKRERHATLVLVDAFGEDEAQWQATRTESGARSRRARADMAAARNRVRVGFVLDEFR